MMSNRMTGSGTVVGGSFDFTGTEIQTDNTGCQATHRSTGTLSGTSTSLEGGFTTTVTFDPGSAASPDSGLFGLPNGPEDAAVHGLGVPFDATTSYRKGTAGGPAAILAASHQVDLLDELTGKPYEAGIWMAPIEPAIEVWNAEATRAYAKEKLDTKRVDEVQEKLNDRVEAAAATALEQGKLFALVGGDHSVPFGSIRERGAL